MGESWVKFGYYSDREALINEYVEQLEVKAAREYYVPKDRLD